VAAAHALLDLPGEAREPVLVVLDEFQALRAACGDGEGVLRSHTRSPQKAGRVAWAFTGSQPSLLAAAFADAGRAYYQKALPVPLRRLADADLSRGTAQRSPPHARKRHRTRPVAPPRCRASETRCCAPTLSRGPHPPRSDGRRQQLARGRRRGACPRRRRGGRGLGVAVTSAAGCAALGRAARHRHGCSRHAGRGESGLSPERAGDAAAPWSDRALRSREPVRPGASASWTSARRLAGAPRIARQTLTTSSRRSCRGPLPREAWAGRLLHLLTPAGCRRGVGS